MDIPKPARGMIINYSYLWHSEAQQGREEGRKDRPSVVVLADKKGMVIVAPITHTRPQAGATAIEIPAQLKKSAGLDHERSWIVTNDVNYFNWPGHDLRRIAGRKGQSVVHGQLPPDFTKQVVQTVDAQMQKRQVKAVNRDDPPPKKHWGKKAEKPSKPKPPPPPSKDRGRSR